MANVVFSGVRGGFVSLHATFHVLSLGLSNWRRRQEHSYMAQVGSRLSTEQDSKQLSYANQPFVSPYPDLTSRFQTPDRLASPA